MKKIHYTVTEMSQFSDGVNQYSSLCLPEVSYDLKSIGDTVDSNYIYTDCPVWSHKANRTYVMRSPIDFQFSVNEHSINPINCPTENFIHLDDGWNNLNPVMQLSMPVLVAWTKHKNIWVDIESSPYTALKNNFTTIGGKWNISRWNRPISFAMQLVDKRKSVRVKRGDPIYYVTFRSSDMNEKFLLVREDHVPNEVFRRSAQNSGIKKLFPGMSSKFLFEKQDTKCPFKFLW
jgi:hypothetical protein